MPEPAPAPCELREELSIRELFPISLVVREGNSDCAEGGVHEPKWDKTALPLQTIPCRSKSRREKRRPLSCTATRRVWLIERFGRQHVHASSFRV